MDTVRQPCEMRRDADAQQRGTRVALEAGLVEKLRELAARAATYAEAAGLNIDSTRRSESDRDA